jgi:LAO/AO transport system kinase
LTSDLPYILKNLDPDNTRILPRLISLVENQKETIPLLASLPNRNIPIIGITGPPGAGKSTILSALIEYLREKGKKLGILAVDPSSALTQGSVLGDRIRMQNHTLDSGVFIRSLANRGYLGGLSAATSDILTVFQAFSFDYIFIETVGVGQSEIDVAGLADTVVVVLVPESGDEIQSIKAGLLEIADILVVNKSDREGAGKFYGILKNMLHEREEEHKTGLVQTIAETRKGIAELWAEIENQLKHITLNRKIYHLVDKAYQILVRNRMQDFDREKMFITIRERIEEPNFNLYAIIKELNH